MVRCVVVVAQVVVVECSQQSWAYVYVVRQKEGGYKTEAEGAYVLPGGEKEGQVP